MEGERVAFSQKERDRLKELHGVLCGELKQREAAKRLGLSVRQVKRLCRRIKKMGDKGVIHALRGRRSNRRIDPKVEAKAVSFLGKDVYRGFGPTLAAEHLSRRGIAQVGRETTRKWMSAAGLWRPRPRHVVEVHTWRERRASFGELVLMDTSDHEWLEKRGHRLKLIGMIDDATSRVIARFVEEDSSEENLRTLRGWLERYGRPVALYTDKNSLFVNNPPLVQEQIHGKPLTNVGQALLELGIEWIPAHSPQAKGRVERLFGTFQDRLVKELRVARVKSLDGANAFLKETFLPFWEERFTVEARNPQDAHRHLGQAFNLDSILCLREERTVASDYTLQLYGKKLAIARRDVLPGLRHARVLVEQRLDGTLWVRFKKTRIPLTPVPNDAPVITPSGLRPPGAITKKKPHWTPKSRPAPDHPWRGTFLLGRKRDTSTLR
jgi:DNA-binding Lrp family transcriptional regulator